MKTRLEDLILSVAVEATQNTNKTTISLAVDTETFVNAWLKKKNSLPFWKRILRQAKSDASA